MQVISIPGSDAVLGVKLLRSGQQQRRLRSTPTDAEGTEAAHHTIHLRGVDRHKETHNKTTVRHRLQVVTSHLLEGRGGTTKVIQVARLRK